jgi:hypothetical protein
MQYQYDRQSWQTSSPPGEIKKLSPIAGARVDSRGSTQITVENGISLSL